jgi:hypothetical protein
LFDRLPEDTVNWAERLGYGADQRVLIVHADDLGLTPSTNTAVFRLMEEGGVSSTSVMAPCPAALEALRWAAGHPELDIGVHATLTSEWPGMRWPPLAEASQVAGLCAGDGALLATVEDVVEHAAVVEMLLEVRTQTEVALAAGVNVSHIDSHMGVLYTSAEAFNGWWGLARQHGVAVPVPQITRATLPLYTARMAWITPELVLALQQTPGPKLSSYLGTPDASSYRQFRESIVTTIGRLPAGLHLLYLHPADDSADLRRVVDSWQKRVWEAAIMVDPTVRDELAELGVKTTTWREVWRRGRAQS